MTVRFVSRVNWLWNDCVETPGAAIFYTLNGEKPAPFQTIGPAAKATFMYQEPFTLPGGKHTIKAVAVSRYVEIFVSSMQHKHCFKVIIEVL